MHKIVIVLVALGVGMVAGVKLYPNLVLHEGARISSVHTGPTIEQIQQLSSLVTLRVDIADVQETTIKGHTGGSKAALIIKGDVLLSVDLRAAKLQDLNAETRTALLTLPQPRVLSPRLDHEKTRLLAVWDYGLWKIVPSDAGQASILNRAYADAQKVVKAAGDSDELRARAREHAEVILGSYFKAVGWQITIRWA